MGKSLRWIGWIVTLLAVAALACNMQRTPPPPPSPTPPPRFCRDFVSIPAYARPASPVEYENRIADYLSAGGSPEELAAMLREWGVLDQYGVVNADNDFDLDRSLDVVVALRYPSEITALQPPGQLLIFSCFGQPLRYRTIYGLATAQDSPTSMPRVIHLGDITGDGQPEIVFYTERCTTLACFREPFILTWNPSENVFRSLSDRFDEFYYYTDENGARVPGFPFAGFEVRDLTGDGPDEFIVQEGDVSLREAGPYRPARYTWTWNGVEYADPVVEYGPSNYRIHALRDADRVLRAGDVDEAIRLYTDTYNNRDLIPWGGIYPKQENYDTEDAMLDAYNRYRLVLAHAAARDGQAQNLLTALQRDLPWQLGNIPSYYTRLAEIFLNAFLFPAADSADPLHDACTQVKSIAVTQMPQTFQFLGNRDYYGPALSNYTPDDLCPF
jgi:hypothetical protein